jgi:hypothetical protein
MSRSICAVGVFLALVYIGIIGGGPVFWLAVLGLLALWGAVPYLEKTP